MIEEIEKAENLKLQLDDLRPLSGETEARIMQKFRLDWNYHSNNLEGNSLTYGETRALILFGVTAQGKPLKDHFEITGHNEAINWILEIVKDERPLTESFIRQLHILLLKEDSFKEALTSDGKPTRRKIEVGKYKSQPNHVVTVTGETFYFASPEETASLMHDLIEWFRDEKEKDDVNPIVLASLFHYKFIRIHPFDDGNGRVARILMNFILMQFGYPPVIIKTDDKENYYAVLRLADADELEPFIEYITQNLIHSLEIMIKGAKGESIDEPEDLDKQIALIEGKLRNRGKKIKNTKSKEAILYLIKNSLIPLFSELINQSQKFDKFYVSKNLLSKITSSKYVYHPQNEDNKLTKLQFYVNSSETGLDINKILLTYEHKTFNQDEFEHFNHVSSVYIQLSKITYKVKSEYILTADSGVEYEKFYFEDLTASEIQNIVLDVSEKHLEFITNRIE